MKGQRPIVQRLALMVLFLGAIFAVVAPTVQARSWPYTDFNIYRDGNKLYITAADGTRIVWFNHAERDRRTMHWVRVRDDEQCTSPRSPAYWPRECSGYKGIIAVYYDSDTDKYSYSWVEGGKYSYTETKPDRF